MFKKSKILKKLGQANTSLRLFHLRACPKSLPAANSQLLRKLTTGIMAGLCAFSMFGSYERSNHSKCRKHTYGKPGIPVSGYGDRKGGDLAGYTVYLWKQGLLVCV